MTRKRLHLAEDVTRGAAPHKVDRDRGIIFGVKILGFESKNGRRYLPEAVQAAKARYDGVTVRINHPRSPRDSRDAGDVFGRITNPTEKPDGLYGDLEYLRSHPLAERICEAAERMPEVFGLSHNAEGEGDYENGTFVVREITDVRSVDVVADPATTKGLFEGVNVKTKIKPFLEGLRPRFDAARQARLKKLLEDMGADLAAAPLDAPAEVAAASPEEALKAGFKSACLAVHDDDSLDSKGKLARLKEIYAAQDKLLSGESSAEKPVEEGDDEGDEGDDGEKDDKEKMESIKAENRQLKAEKAVRLLCEQHKVTPSAVLLEALIALPEAKRKALIEEHRSAANGAGRAGAPRTQIPGGAGSNGTGRRSFVEAITGGAK